MNTRTIIAVLPDGTMRVLTCTEEQAIIIFKILSLRDEPCASNAAYLFGNVAAFVSNAEKVSTLKPLAL